MYSTIYVPGYKSYWAHKLSPIKSIQGRKLERAARGATIVACDTLSWPDKYVYHHQNISYGMSNWAHKLSTIKFIQGR